MPDALAATALRLSQFVNSKIKLIGDMAKSKAKRKPPGPEPETLKIEGNWKDAMRKLISKKKPASGWPKAKER
jgi:hypothetical protein